MDTMRITGIASGLDTEQIIKDLMSIETAKVDRVKQDKQYAVWEQEGYREIINELKSFQDKYLDVLNQENYIMSENTFNALEANSTINGEKTNAVSIVATSNAIESTHTISNITLAEKDVWKGTNIANMISSGLDFTSINVGDQINVTLDGNIKTITLDGGYITIDELATDLQNEIDTAFGAGKVTVGKSGSELTFESDGHIFQVSDTNSGDTVLTTMGFSTGDKNVLDKTKSLGDTNFSGDIFGAETEISFSINGEVFTFDKTSDTVQDLLDEVNGNTTANVTMYYSEVSNSFVMESDKEGSINQITFEDITGSFFSVGIGIDKGTNTGHINVASDAEFTLDGVITTRSANTFTVDGIAYTLNESTINTIDVKVTTNIEDVKNTIVSFVDDYNNLIEKLNEKLYEERHYDFKPLTEAQKDEMSEEEIETWEEKAKSGLLKSDYYIRKIVYDLRETMYSEVSGAGISLYEMGIQTSIDYNDGGKLIIDEEKLDETLKNKATEVKKLFTDSNEGLAVKIKGILDTNIKTTGEKGILLQKAGMEGNVTAFDNILSDKIEEYDDKINDLLDYLVDKENHYYLVFAQMEKALSQMNAQSGWLASQFGQGM